MPDRTPSEFLTGAGTDTWTLWLKIMATGATATLSTLMVVFTWALYRNRDREAPVALHFTIANMAATVYVSGDIAVRICLLEGTLESVMLPYRLSLAAVVIALAALICLQQVLRRRQIPGPRLAVVYAVGAGLAVLLWVRHPAMIIASDRFTTSDVGVFADYGSAATLFFVACLLLFAITAYRILRRAHRADGTLVWRMTVFGFSVFFLAGVHDTFRELGVELLPFSALTLGCALFQIGAFAAMAIHYSRTLHERTHHDHQLRRLADKATRDPLSGLFNRAYLENRLDSLAAAAKGGLLFVDLDHFKAVNDRFGHDHGDRLILAVAEQIRQSMRDEDIACRWGGDEFVIFLAEAGVTAAQPVADRLLRAFAAIQLPGAVGLDVSASMGFAELADGDWRITLQRADQALYRAKAGGRNRLAVARPVSG